MTETARMWTEIGFNITYLIVVWALVALMAARHGVVAPENRRVAGLFTGAFALLALGDTGHVGFRVVDYAQHGFVPSGDASALVGFGALATAITVTFFYVLMLVIWRARFARPYGWFGILLFVTAAARLAIMALPANQWNLAVPPQPWSTIRNVPLMIQGLGVAYLILRDAGQAADRRFTWIGVSIFVSYACYMPVIFLVQRLPIVGMLMIPKTLAYLAVALLAYRGLYPSRGARRMPQPA